MATPPSAQDILAWASETGSPIDERSAALASRVIGAVTYAKAPDFEAAVKAAAPPPPKPNRDVAELDGLKILGRKALSDGAAKFWHFGPAPCWRAPYRQPGWLWPLWALPRWLCALPWWLWALYLFAGCSHAVWVWGMGGFSWAGVGSTIYPGPALLRLTFLALPLPALIFLRSLPPCICGWRWKCCRQQHRAILSELVGRETPRLGPGASTSLFCKRWSPSAYFFCKDNALVSPSADYTVLLPKPLASITERQPLAEIPVVYKGYLALLSLCACGFFCFFVVVAFITYCFLLQAAYTNNSSTLHAECLGSTLVTSSAPSFPPCFVRQQQLPFAAVAALAEAVNASAGVFTLAAAPFAADVCAPIAAAMSQKTTVYNFTSYGLLYRFGFLNSGSFENSAGTGVHPVWLLWVVSWPLLVPLLYVFLNYSRLKKVLSSKAWYPMSIAQNLRQLIEPNAYLHFLSYTWWDPTDPFAELLSILLPDCFIDRACLPPGANVSVETVKGAVHARCLVLSINERYLRSTACLKELFAAIFHRRENTAALCDIGPKHEEVNHVNWDALKSVLEDAFLADWHQDTGTEADAGKEAVFFDIGGLLRWVRHHDLSPDDGTRERVRERTIFWFRDHKRVSLSSTLLAAGKLLSSFPTRCMMAGERDYGTLTERVLAWLTTFFVSDPYALFPRAGLKRLLCSEVKCVPRPYGAILDHKLIFFFNIILFLNGVAALIDACLVFFYAPTHSLAYSSAVGLVDAGAFVLDLVAIVFSAILGLFIKAALHYIDPRLYYSDYLEPLCLAARIFEVEESPSLKVRVVRASRATIGVDLEMPLIQPSGAHAIHGYDSFEGGRDFCIRIFCLTHDRGSAKADERDNFLRALRDFLKEGLGLRALYHSHDDFTTWRTQTMRGLVVCVLDSDKKEHIDSWLEMVRAVNPDCIVPVVYRMPTEPEPAGDIPKLEGNVKKKGDVMETLNIMEKNHLDKLGEAVLRALARKVGASILCEDIRCKGEMLDEVGHGGKR